MFVIRKKTGITSGNSYLRSRSVDYFGKTRRSTWTKDTKYAMKFETQQEAEEYVVSMHSMVILKVEELTN